MSFSFTKGQVESKGGMKSLEQESKATALWCLLGFWGMLSLQNLHFDKQNKYETNLASL